MSQGEVLKILEKAEQPLCSKQIAEVIKIRMGTVATNLRRLIKQREVKFVWMSKNNHDCKYYFVDYPEHKHL